MEDGIRQLIDMLANLKLTVEDGFEAIDRRFEEVDKRFEAIDKRFDSIDKRFDTVEVAIQELNSNQIKIMNSMKLFERDIKRNTAHIERLEEKESYL